jgi:predicted site-specific integrase-resolvase
MNHREKKDDTASLPIETETDDIPIDKQDVLLLLHISSRTLQRWRSKGLLDYYRLGRKIYYSKKEVLDLVKKFRVHKKQIA